MAVQIELLTLGTITEWRTIEEAAVALDTYPRRIYYTINESKHQRIGLWKLTWSNNRVSWRHPVVGQKFEPFMVMQFGSARRAAKDFGVPWYSFQFKKGASDEKLVDGPDGLLYRATKI